MKLSIIVTAYNEEKYIRRCLDSFTIQKTKFDYEVIIVNDGSTDGTQDIINQYVGNFSNIFRAFYKDNSGQGMSRNLGIEKAVGEYIGFTDADDWVEPSFVEKMCNSAKQHDSDVVICDVHKIYVDKKLEEDVRSLDSKDERVNIANYIRNGQSNSYSWNKIYKRDIWQQFKFKKMAYEDLDIVIPILSNCHTVTYVAVSLYNYYKHSGTTTSSYRSPRLFDIFTAYTDLLKNVNKRFLIEAEFCVAKRIMINIDTPGFGYHLGYFIQLIQQLNDHFKINECVQIDNYVKEINYFSRVSLLENNIFVDGSQSLSTTKSYRYDENVIDFTNQRCTYADLKAGGIILRKNIQLLSPVGYLRALGNFVIVGENHKVLAAGLERESLVLQRLFLGEQELRLNSVLDRMGSLVEADNSITFDVTTYDISDLENKLKIKEAGDESFNF